MRCSASGISSAPGTVASVMSSSRTCCFTNCARHAPNKPSHTSVLKRLCTMPIRRPLPLRFFSSSFISVSVILLLAIGVTHHFQPESRHARHLADIEVSQYLRADAVAARIPLCGLLASRIQGGTRAQILRCLATMQQHQYAGRRLSDFLHGLIHADRMRMIGLFQKIHHRKRFVYAHQSLGIMANITLHQGHMSALRGLVHVGPQFEFAISSLHLAPCHTLDQFLMLAAVLDEIGNRANF